MTDPNHDVPLSSSIVRAHEAALAAGRPTYVDPTTGYEVFTEATLLAHGTCCGSGCRHCPYPIPTGV